MLERLKTFLTSRRSEELAKKCEKISTKEEICESFNQELHSQITALRIENEELRKMNSHNMFVDLAKRVYQLEAKQPIEQPNKLSKTKKKRKKAK
jgi:hypothetical protein